MNKIIRKAIVLALAGSALLYSGCTKDYAEEITTLQKDLSELNDYTTEHINGLQSQVDVLKNTVSSLEEARDAANAEISTLKTRVSELETAKNTMAGQITTINQQIAGINSEIAALQSAVNGINEAIDAANQRITDLQNTLANDYYKKADVDSKIQALKDYANETFATKETVAQINSALGTLTGVVEGIQTTLEGVQTELAGVKTTAETALANANQALGEIATLSENLRDNYYTKAEVEAKLETLKGYVDSQVEALQGVDAELAAADVKINERIDSLANVSKAIEKDLADFKEETAEMFLGLSLALIQEIAYRQADSLLLVQEIAERKADVAALNTLITELKDTTVQIRTQLNAALDKIAANKQAIEIEKAAREQLAREVETIRQNLQGQIDDLVTVTNGLRSDLDNAVARLTTLENDFAAVKERIQSIVFVPEYTDFLASANYIVYGRDTLRTVVKATYEVKPVAALDYVLENVDSLVLAARELASRADVDAVYTDIVLLGSDKDKGRFTVEAYVPEILHEGITAVSMVFGNYEVGSYGLSGNSIQSSYVGMYFDPDKNVDLSGRYTWYNTNRNERERADTIKCIDHVAYTAPVIFDNPRVCFSDYAIYMEDEGQFVTPQTLETKYHLDAGTLSTFTYPAAKWTVFGVNGDRVDDKTPFNFEKDVPATEFFTDYIVTADNDTIINKMYVGDTTRHIQNIKRGEEELRLVAFAQFDITKNIIAGYNPVQCDTIRWNYTLYDPQVQKSYAQNATFDVTDDVLNGKQNSVATAFTHNGSDFVLQNQETMTIGNAKVVYNNWLFEADTVNYVSMGWEFETESDIYPDVEIPFVVLPVPADRTATIDLGTIAYTPTYGYGVDGDGLFEAIEKAFKGEEEYFIGDAEGDAASKSALYSAFVESMPFEIDSYSVDGEEITIDPTAAEYPFTINLAYNEDAGDVSNISIEAGTFNYGVSVTVKGHVDAFGVKFSFVINFSTPELPFQLVLTPYGSFDPEKSKTIIVEGDDKFDENGEETDVDDDKRYNIQQMFYTKYLQVQDKEGNPTNYGEDLDVRFEFVYEDLSEFGFEFDETATAADSAAAIAQRGEFGGVTDIVDVLGGDLAGYLDQQAILTWGTYQGRQVKAYATLYDNDIQVSEPLEFNIWTMKPIELKSGLVIGSESDPLIRRSGEQLELTPASVMVVGGVLSRDSEYNPYYVQDASVFGYNDNNVVIETFYTGHRPNRVYHPAGEFHPFYGYLHEVEGVRKVSTLEFNFNSMDATLNREPWTLTRFVDWDAEEDENGALIFKVLEDSAKGDLVINIPISFRYYLDYCGAKKEQGVVTVYIRNI